MWPGVLVTAQRCFGELMRIFRSACVARALCAVDLTSLMNDLLLKSRQVRPEFCLKGGGVQGKGGGGGGGDRELLEAPKAPKKNFGLN